ncbi:MAG: hypothetical protein A2Y17_04640 [Clostridiales bacterium GWF2_38_85]|nr:MAG: hypothetical protein A2Y17_04640 [Clostridiales bacterium GWF2_38_85]HBL84425.1 NUDIX hydrolase [Clostridiales bacterium]
MPNNNFTKSIGCIVMRGNDVLLVKHTYGSANGRYLTPGGCCNENEAPEATAHRELWEETKIKAEIKELVGIRFFPDSWYVVFKMDYVEGTPTSDGFENSEAIFMDINEAITHPLITNLSKVLLESMLLDNSNGLKRYANYTSPQVPEATLYGVNYTKE